MNPTLRDRLGDLLVALVREAQSAPDHLQPLTLRDFVGNMVVEVRVRPERYDPTARRDEAEETIVDLLATHHTLRTCQFVRALVKEDICSASTVKRRLRELVRRGVIVRHPSRGGYSLALQDGGRGVMSRQVAKGLLMGRRGRASPAFSIHEPGR